MRNQRSVAKKVDKKSKILFFGKLEGVSHGTNMIMGPHFSPVLVQIPRRYIKVELVTTAQYQSFRAVLCLM